MTKCNTKICPLKDNCKRTEKTSDVNWYDNFYEKEKENILKNGKCNFFKQKNAIKNKKITKKI